ncbi:MAG: hypothetical protein ABI683_16050, partial [Ginsengibacter sp.]
MPFDKLDKKAKEAAERYNAEYNEEAWSKMEALLDKHMPVTPVQQPALKEKKFHEKWLLLLLGFIIVSSVLFFTKPWRNNGQHNSEETTIKENSQTKELRSTSAANEIKDNQSTISIINATNDQNKAAPLLSSNQAGNNLAVINNVKDHSSYKRPLKKLKTDVAHLVMKTRGSEIEEDEAKWGEVNDKPVANNFTVSNSILFQKIDSWFNLNHADAAADNINAPSLKLTVDASNIKNKNSNNPPKNNFGKSFVISLSVGPDVSAIDLNNVGTVEILYGAGIGYKFAKRWMVRTGFYSVRKVYGAKPTNYNPPNTFWTYYPNLVDIMANCKVNEIPLIVNYTFGNNSKQSWFASAGLSSYFMKREIYDYRSKSPSSGTTWTKSYTVSNEYKHYLASLRLSAGYEKVLSNKISISAEPYINLPLSGIGYGKVKLNSAG